MKTIAISSLFLILSMFCGHSQTLTAVLCEKHSNTALRENLITFVEGVISTHDEFSILARTHLSTVNSEQNLYKENITNNTKTGKLLGAQLLFVISITDDYNQETEQIKMIDGQMCSEIIRTCNISFTMRAIDVETGKQLGQGATSARGLRFEQIAQHWKTDIDKVINSINMTRKSVEAIATHKLFINPTNATEKNSVYDVFVDGNFVGHTPIAVEVESGIREVCVKNNQYALWKNSVRVNSDVWLSPQIN